jgi:hypothetical protein
MMRFLTVALMVLGAAAWAQESDPGRPILKRGGPATQREKPSEAPPPAPPKDGPVYKEITVDEEGRGDRSIAASPENEADELIERARAAAYEFNDKLPDFICDQVVMRYESKTRKPEWKQKDRVQVELTYAGGKEDYRNVRVNGKRLKKGSPEDSGSWSTGEFGTTLADIMASNTDARFRLRNDASTAAGLKARVFDFSVEQANSHWTIRYGRSVRPAYKGALWIDPESARVLRIEMDSRQLPVDYDFDKVEMTVDYGWVVINAQRYLLPVKSEVLACQTHSFSCMKNTIEYRNYRKFAVESQLLQVESEITFEGEEKEKGKTEPPSITPEQPKTAPAKKK